MNNEPKDLNANTNKVDRRKFLQMSAMLGAGMAVTGLVGCGTSASTATTNPATGAAGTLATAPEIAWPYYPNVKLVVPPSKDGKKIRVGLSMQPTQYFWQRYQAALILRLEELGAEPVVVWTGPAMNETLVGIESLIQQKPDAVVLGGCNKETFIPILPVLDKAGIKYIGVENDTPGIPIVVKNYAWAGALSIGALVQRLGGKGTVAVFTAPGIHIIIDMNRKILDDVLSFYPNIKIVEVPCRWPDAEKAGLEDMENLLRTRKDIDAVWCSFDGPLFGAAQAIKGAGMQDKMFICTSSGDDHVWEALAAGDPSWEMGCFSDFWETGRRAAEFAVMAARGEKPPMFSHVYGCYIDKSNAVAYSKIMKEQNKLADETLKKYGRK